MVILYYKQLRHLQVEILPDACWEILAMTQSNITDTWGRIAPLVILHDNIYISTETLIFTERYHWSGVYPTF